MAKAVVWGDREEWQRQLLKRLKQCKSYRKKYEGQWRVNETTVLNAVATLAPNVAVTPEGVLRLDGDDVNASSSEMGINYTFKYIRFLHAQMSANPPSVLARPATTDRADRRSASAADRIVRHAMRTEEIPEVVDDMNLKTLTYGTGLTKMVWNPDIGQLSDYDKDTQEILMSGSHETYAPSIWNIWLDPDAKRQRDLRYVFEMIEMPFDEACFLFPKSADDLKRVINMREHDVTSTWYDRDEVGQNQTEIVQVYEYYEKGAPINGMVGRHAYCLADGTLLTDPAENPYPDAQLPYHLLTDIDVPDSVYGKSVVEYLARLQDILNRLDSTILDNIQAHGTVRLVLPDGAEIEDQAITNSSWDWVKVSGGGGEKPTFMNPPQLMPDIYKFREQLLQGMQELAGISESNMGQTSREMSGFSIQTLIDASNTVRRRLFNKYAHTVESIYRGYLEIARHHWDEPRTIMVLGKEHAFETSVFMGSDIAGGFDLVVEYGASLSLDPARRREEIMQLKDFLKEAGVKPKTILKMIKLNDLDSLYDFTELGELRQSEIFDEMIARNVYIAPAELQDHQAMLEWAYYYLMSEEFTHLDDGAKALVREHVKAREQLAATVATQGSESPPASPPGAPAAGGPPPTLPAAVAPPPAPVAPPAVAPPVAA